MRRTMIAKLEVKTFNLSLTSLIRLAGSFQTKSSDLILAVIKRYKKKLLALESGCQRFGLLAARLSVAPVRRPVWPTSC